MNWILDRQVDFIIEEYATKIKHRYTDIGNFFEPRDLRNFIESKAVFTELMYPDVYYDPLDSSRDGFSMSLNPSQPFTWNLFRKSHPRLKRWPENSVSERNLYYFTTEKFRQEKFNQAVLCRIIERGGGWIGARRGALFARDFDMSQELPVQYSADLSDPRLYDFLVAVGACEMDPNMMVPSNYFFRTSNSGRGIKELRLGYVIEQAARPKKELSA